MHTKKMFNLYADYFKALDQLQARVLICYTAKDFLAKNFSYERKIYRARLRLFSMMKKIRVMVEQEKVPHLSALENIYEIIFSLNTLKLRVSDVSVFEIFQDEIKALTQDLGIVLQQMILFFLHQNQKDKKNALIFLYLTFLFGISFLVMELLEFSHLFQEGSTPQRSAFLSSYFSLVGTHGLHITAGLLWMVILFISGPLGILHYVAYLR